MVSKKRLLLSDQESSQSETWRERGKSCPSGITWTGAGSAIEGVTGMHQAFVSFLFLFLFSSLLVLQSLQSFIFILIWKNDEWRKKRKTMTRKETFLPFHFCSICLSIIFVFASRDKSERQSYFEGSLPSHSSGILLTLVFLYFLVHSFTFYSWLFCKLTLI